MTSPDSPVAQWFQARYGQPTAAQRDAWPRIHAGRDVLIASPTGTGKTFAAFYSVLDALAREHAAGTLQPSVQCLYVSPLRALGYDLEKNLQLPLQEIYGEKPPIRVELRSGDTGQAQRARQFHKPPHIILTTPESLCVILSQERWVPLLATVRWIIVDEIHALADNKRGAHLSLTVERLAYEVARTGRRLQRIGLSATIAPLEEVAQYLSGTSGQCEIIDVSSEKKIELSIYTPLRKNPYPPSGFTGERLVKELGGLIQKYRTTLVFTNTRSGAEATSFWLRENFPAIAGQIECHHASLERGVRREVEDRLKRGELRAVICSTSLELGIDIGSVDLVVMLATPKGVSRALQRAGRAGHNIHSVSRGMLMATNVSDLVEACATVRLARSRKLDYVHIPEAPLDVLAQHIVSMGCLQSWSKEDALELIRRSYCYRELTMEVFIEVLEYLAGGGKALRQQYTEVFGKINWDGDFFETREGRVRREFLQNIGTIPDTVSVRVRMKRKALGSVEESFMRMLKIGDVFIMAGRAVRLEKVSQLEASVTAADGENPTVPRWNAAKMPLSNRVCEEIVDFRSELKTRLEADPTLRGPRTEEVQRFVPSDLWTHPQKRVGRDRSPKAPPQPVSPHALWIAERLDCGQANAEMIWQMYDAQHRISEIPTADFLLIEEHLEYPRDHVVEGAGFGERGRKRSSSQPAPPEAAAPETGYKRGPARRVRQIPKIIRPEDARKPTARHYFFHSLIGRAANDALARVVSYRLSKLRGGNAVATPHDYGFVLSVAPQQSFTAEEIPELIRPEGFDDDLSAALAESEMVKYHFRNAAQTGLMVYRNYFDERKPMRKVQWSSEVIFNVLHRYEPDHILLREARREALHVYVDVDGGRAFCEEQARRPIRLRRVEYVPPLSFAMYATKIKEALLVEDPFEMMERLYHLWWSQIEGAGPGEA